MQGEGGGGHTIDCQMFSILSLLIQLLLYLHCCESEFEKPTDVGMTS